MGGSSGGGGGGGARGSERRSRPKKQKRGGSGGPGPIDADGDACELDFEVDLSGIDKAVLSSVAVGQELSVTLQRRGAYSAVVCSAPGGVLGSLAAFPKLTTLISCLGDGHGYSATIVRIGTGSCRVRVRRVSTP